MPPCRSLDHRSSTYEILKRGIEGRGERGEGRGERGEGRGERGEGRGERERGEGRGERGEGREWYLISVNPFIQFFF